MFQRLVSSMGGVAPVLTGLGGARNFARTHNPHLCVPHASPTQPFYHAAAPQRPDHPTTVAAGCQELFSDFFEEPFEEVFERLVD